MFRTASSSYGRAGDTYRQLDINTRVEGASPHRLIAILFEELLTSIATTKAAMLRGDMALRAKNHSRALSIVQALDGSIDFDQGEVSAQLSSIYRETTRLLLKGVRESDAPALDEARAMIGEIATAWSAIG